jgi:phosphoribosylglycinamide formyltransferase-1
MTRPEAEDPRLVALSKICLGLPEAERKVTGQHADFRVRGRVFAYFLSNHHGDGIVAVCTRLALGENADLVAGDPVRYYLPAYIGPRGWVGLRLDLGEVDWQLVREMIDASYRMVAPARLVQQL